MFSKTLRNHRRSGFTLIEILIVVVILGILASIAMPQLSSASTSARESTLKEDLRYLRTQVTCFKYQHRDVAPGFVNGDITATADETTFLDQMTRFTDDVCNSSTSASTVYRLGPYLSRMPPNPISGKANVLVVTGLTMPSPDEALPYGWIYNPTLQRVVPNLSGVDTGGVPYANY